MCLVLSVSSIPARYYQADVNFINMFMCGFFAWKTKKLLVFENEFHHAFLYKNCADCAICKLHSAVLVAIRKSQLVVHRKNFKKAGHKNVDEINTSSVACQSGATLGTLF
jgi:hypothetical protein